MKNPVGRRRISTLSCRIDGGRTFAAWHLTSANDVDEVQSATATTKLRLISNCTSWCCSESSEIGKTNAGHVGPSCEPPTWGRNFRQDGRGGESVDRSRLQIEINCLSDRFARPSLSLSLSLSLSFRQLPRTVLRSAELTRRTNQPERRRSAQRSRISPQCRFRSLIRRRMRERHLRLWLPK